MDPEQKNNRNKVIEYYKKYSQNPQLIKYFTGSEASFVGKESPNTDSTSGPEEPHSSIKLPGEFIPRKVDTIENEGSCSPKSIPSPTPLEVNQTDELEQRNESRSSSVASNKIEWDNGADIGYKNSYLFLSTKKSASFPSLLPNNLSVNNKTSPKDSSDKTFSENVEELRKMYNQLTFSSDTSSGTDKEAHSVSKDAITTSSSEESKVAKTSTKTSSSSDSYLKKRIGYPVAYSTPHEESSSKQSTSSISKESNSECSEETRSKSKYDAYTVTPMLTLPNKPKRNLNVEQLPSTDKEEKKLASIDNRKGESSINVVKQEIKKNIKTFNKRINLCLTKPVFLECISVESKESVHKDVQTSFSTEKLSKSVQTEGVELSEISDQNVRYTPQILNIEFINSSKEKSDDVPQHKYKTQNPVEYHSNLQGPSYVERDEKNCKATQTDSVCLEKSAKSHKVIHSAKKSQNKENIDCAQTTKISMNQKNSESSSAKSSSKSTNSTNGNTDSTDNSVKTPPKEFKAEELLLAEMISLNYSKDLNTDIKRSISILQKLLKSRKYDQATKKYYIKKIVQKIVDSKYAEDSTSSDLFRPGNSTQKNVPDVSKTQTECFKKTANFTSSDLCRPENSTQKNAPDVSETQTECYKKTANLMDNLPWYPASEPIYPTQQRKTEKITETAPEKDTVSDIEKYENDLYNFNTLKDETFVIPIQKGQVENPNIQVQKSRKTSISSEGFAASYSGKVIKHQDTNRGRKKNSKKNSNSSSELPNHLFTEKEFRQSSSERNIGVHDWRADKTASEKILENRDILDFKKGQGDYLLHVVKNERHHQLSWINNEIEHLVQLKELLEKKPENVSPDSKLREVISSLLKMKEEDMKGIPRNFEVFICNESQTNGNENRERKTASLTADYYTIETQLDPDGNLLDLTVYDGSGNRKYNYRTDGVVNDISISSKNRNTAVKLKPKFDFPGRLPSAERGKSCECGRGFTSSSRDSNISVCVKCTQNNSRVYSASSKAPQRKYKVCRICGIEFIPPSHKPSSSICQDCMDEEPEPDRRDISKRNAEICKACGRLFLQKKEDSILCLCKSCKKEFSPSEVNNEQSMCDKGFELTLRRKKKCSCLNGAYKKEMNYGRSPPVEICKVCGIDLNECVCGLKFLPKKPRLVGENTKKTQIEKGTSCTHCIGVQAGVIEPSTCVRRRAIGNTPQDHFSKLILNQQTKKDGESCTVCSNSSQTSPNKRTVAASSRPRQKSPVESPGPIQFSPIPTPVKGTTYRNEAMMKKETYNSPQSKNSQCCTCSDYEIQAKIPEPGNENSEWSCCICEKRIFQVSQDGNCKKEKSIISKHCKSKSSSTKANRKTATYDTLAEFDGFEKNKKNQTDELDDSGDSTHSVPSENLILIVPTKYKQTNKARTDFQCQCRSRRKEQTDQNKSIQICTSVTRSFSRAVNTIQDDPKKSSVGTDSFVFIRIPQEVQCDFDVQQQSQTFLPEICIFASSASPRPSQNNIPKRRCQCQTRRQKGVEGLSQQSDGHVQFPSLQDFSEESSSPPKIRKRCCQCQTRRVKRVESLSIQFDGYVQFPSLEDVSEESLSPPEIPGPLPSLTVVVEPFSRNSPSPCRTCPPPSPCKPCSPLPCTPRPSPCKPCSPCPPIPSPCKPCSPPPCPSIPSPCRPCPTPPPCKPCSPPSAPSGRYQKLPPKPPCSCCRPCPPPCVPKLFKSPLLKLFENGGKCSAWCKPFPFGCRGKTPVYGQPPSTRRYFQDSSCQCEDSPPAPTDYRGITGQPGAAAVKEHVWHVPCELCGIPPCAAMSSMNCHICSKCKHNYQTNYLDAPKFPYAKTKSKTCPNPKCSINYSRNDHFEYVSNVPETKKKICQPCGKKFPNREDEQYTSSCSFIPACYPHLDESDSCESVDYPCKKESLIMEAFSEQSFTCPSKKPICPAIPPPCPAFKDKHCPKFPPKPCPSWRNNNLGEENPRRNSSRDERRGRERRSQEGNPILFPLSIKPKSPLRETGTNTRKSNLSENAKPKIRKRMEIHPTTANHTSRRSETSRNNQGYVEPRKSNSEGRGCPQQQFEQRINVECKCNQTTTHEDKDIQYPLSMQCICQTDLKEDANVQCECKDSTGVSNKENEDVCECRSPSSSTSNTNTETTASCICCKKDKILKNLINKMPLCEPCQKVNTSNFYPHDYQNPLHSCLCYKLVENNLLCEFKQTINELQRLDIYQQYCEVLKNCKCCKKCGCKCKLPKRFRNGCAYFLKLEEAAPDEVGKGKGERCKGGCYNPDDDEDRENYLPEVTVKVPSLRTSRTKNKTKENDKETRKYVDCPSIQNYLCTMKPEFVARADRRRRILRDATVEREENSEMRKLNFIERINYLNRRKQYNQVPCETAVQHYCYQTKAYCMYDIELNNSPKKVKPKLFKSFKEMKELTRKRYLTLNEVRSKKDLNREKRLREANRLLANTFTRRLQKSTLKGAVDIPLNVKVISY